MEAVTTYTILGVELVRYCVHKGVIGHRLVESGIKHANLRNIGQNGLDSTHTLQVSGVMERSQVVASDKGIKHLLGQEHRLTELLTAMHHTVAYGVNLIQTLDSTIFSAGQRLQNKLYTHSMFGDILLQNLLLTAGQSEFQE